MDAYAWGNTIRMWAEIRNPETGALETPVGVFCEVRRPTGALVTLPVVAVSAGLVHADYDPQEPGAHQWNMRDPAGGGGDPAGAGANAFYIEEPV